MDKPDTIKIDDVEYIRKDQQNMAVVNGLRYVICRSYYAGVFAGYLESRKDREVVLRNARRIWYWDGAASLSQIAMLGVSKPENCKFAIAVDRVELLEVCEILDCTQIAMKNIQGVPLWTK